MSSELRSLLVHVDGSTRCAARLSLARSLAAEHGAQVDALMAVSPSFADLPFAYAAGPEAAAAMQAIDTDRHHRGRMSFEAASRGSGPQMHWSDAGSAPPVAAFIEAALCHDLLVLGQRDADDASSYGTPPDFVEAVVLGSGKPALVLPYAGSFEQVGREVLIAWKPGKESARAVDGALPLLRAARQIHVLRAAEGDESPVTAQTQGDLEAHLARHGIAAPVVQHGRSGPLSGEALLSLASDVGADLMVMGCYGHSRATEWVLGGVTRTVLKAMTVPTLLAH